MTGPQPGRAEAASQAVPYRRYRSTEICSDLRDGRDALARADEKAGWPASAGIGGILISHMRVSLYRVGRHCLRVVRDSLVLRPEVCILKTKAGISDVLAATIMLETGNIARFPGVGHFSFYCRCGESKRISHGKKRSEGDARNGNRYLAWAFIEVAAEVLRSCVQINASAP